MLKLFAPWSTSHRNTSRARPWVFLLGPQQPFPQLGSAQVGWPHVRTSNNFKTTTSHAFPNSDAPSAPRTCWTQLPLPAGRSRKPRSSTNTRSSSRLGARTRDQGAHEARCFRPAVPPKAAAVCRSCQPVMAGGRVRASPIFGPDGAHRVSPRSGGFSNEKGQQPCPKTNGR